MMVAAKYLEILFVMRLHVSVVGLEVYISAAGLLPELSRQYLRPIKTTIMPVVLTGCALQSQEVCDS